MRPSQRELERDLDELRDERPSVGEPYWQQMTARIDGTRSSVDAVPPAGFLRRLAAAVDRDET